MKKTLVESPLFTALNNRNFDEFKRLIETGADVNETDYKQDSLLHIAAFKGYSKIVKLLIDSGADVLLLNINCKTPLDYAKLQHRLRCIRYLVNAIRKKNLSRYFLELMNLIGLKYLNLDEFKKLYELSKTPVNNRVIFAQNKLPAVTLLQQSILHNRIDIAKYLIDEGADVNQTNALYKTPLFIAAVVGNIEMVKLLVHSGADVYEYNMYGESPLHAACQEGYLDVVKFFIENGVDINIKDNHDCTPLTNAIFKGKLDVTKYLIVKGADKNILTNNGGTILHWAVQSKNIDIVKYLVEDANAELNAKNKDGLTPLWFAHVEKQQDIIDYLTEKGATK
ncbi:MAG: ankyrin repeat domain-containing protein [Planctomycetaceae bacterium]|jgi:ankyrin repeat protein|nr:ankyrin repeat domain-containing protein [Planctomycetaceae bacterium]